MNENISIIEIGKGLADAELLSYTYDRNIRNLVVKIQAWDASLLEFSFFDPIFFLDRSSNDITEFCQLNFESDLFRKALERAYDVIPPDHPYKLYQFLDLDDQPGLEIVCDHFDVKIHEAKIQ